MLSQAVMTLFYLAASFFLTIILSFCWLSIARKKSIVEYSLLAMNKAKQGTPTIGGIVILIPVLLALLVNRSFTFLVLAGFAMLFFIIGLADDIVKIRKKRNLGLSKLHKLYLHFAFGIIFCILFYFTTSKSIPFLIFNALYFVFFEVVK